MIVTLRRRFEREQSLHAVLTAMNTARSRAQLPSTYTTSLLLAGPLFYKSQGRKVRCSKKNGRVNGQHPAVCRTSHNAPTAAGTAATAAASLAAGSRHPSLCSCGGRRLGICRGRPTAQVHAGRRWPCRLAPRLLCLLLLCLLLDVWLGSTPQGAQVQAQASTCM